jgi:hypothetical protein
MPNNSSENDKTSVQGFYFDARYIRIDHHDGISRFSAGLFAAINKLTDVTAIISDQIAPRDQIRQGHSTNLCL